MGEGKGRFDLSRFILSETGQLSLYFSQLGVDTISSLRYNYTIIHTEVKHNMNQRRYKPTLDRGQALLLPSRVEDYVGENHQIRALDAYVDTLDLASLGFRHTETGRVAGQPPYNPWAMLKLYLYGYQHGIRSSRKLEAETRRNLEVIWLVKGTRPSYKSIADFRKNHVAQLREVNRDFVLLCKELDLFGGDEVAVDGSFFSGDASRGSIHTEAYIDKRLEEIERKIEEYHKTLEEADADDEKTGKQDTGNDEVLLEKIEKLRRRQEKKKDIKASMERSGQTQVSMVDPDARLLRKRGQSVAGYNAQIAVDSKHKLVVTEDVVQDGADQHQLAGMLVETKRRLGAERLTGLADGGYYESTELKRCEDEDITVYVPVPETGARIRKRGRYSLDEFTYDTEQDCYWCPQGKRLTSSGKATRRRGKRYFLYLNRGVDCKGCLLRSHCIGEKTRVRGIRRWEHQEVLERHAERMEGGAEKMRNRGKTVEHPFGTLKSRCGIHQFLMRGLEKCRGEFSLMTMVYNFTRVLNILGARRLREYCAGRRVYGPQMA